MPGIADNAKMMSPKQIYDTQYAIDTAYMGAGEIFSQLCRKAGG